MTIHKMVPCSLALMGILADTLPLVCVWGGMEDNNSAAEIHCQPMKVVHKMAINTIACYSKSLRMLGLVSN